jgi:hypothetical protein
MVQLVSLDVPNYDSNLWVAIVILSFNRHIESFGHHEISWLDNNQ